MTTLAKSFNAWDRATPPGRIPELRDAVLDRIHDDEVPRVPANPGDERASARETSELLFGQEVAVAPDPSRLVSVQVRSERLWLETSIEAAGKVRLEDIDALSAE